jgi:hypothetical protein
MVSGELVTIAEPYVIGVIGVVHNTTISTTTTTVSGLVS